MTKVLNGILITLILVTFVFCAGCENLGVSVTYDDIPTQVSTPTPTEIPEVTETPVLEDITENITENITEEITEEITELITVIITPIPTPELKAEVNITPTLYTEYTDQDIKIEYPSDWAVKRYTASTVNSTFISRNRLSTMSRIVVFESRNGISNFTMYTTDLITPGESDFDPSIGRGSASVTQRFNDVTSSVLTNFEKKYTTATQSPYITFDVNIPKTSKFYPYAYTERDLITQTQFYTFRFNVRGSLEDYKELKTHMFNTLQAGAG